MTIIWTPEGKKSSNIKVSLVDAPSGAIPDGVEFTDNKGQPDGYAALDGDGLLPVSQLPPIATTETYIVANEAAQLTTPAQTGDLAVRTDVLKTFVLSGSDPSMIADWQELVSMSETFLYNSSGGQGGHRFNNWADLMTATSAVDGPWSLTFEQNEEIPAGEWDLTGGTLRGTGVSAVNGGISLYMGTGAYFVSDTSLTVDEGLGVVATGSTTPIRLGSYDETLTPQRGLFQTVFNKGAVLGTAVGSTAPAATVPAGQVGVIALIDGGQFVPGDVPPVNVDGTLYNSLGPVAGVPDGSLSGSGFIVYLYQSSAASVSQNQPGYSGSYYPLYFTSPVNVGFTPSPGTEGNWFTSPTTVQQALDEMGGRFAQQGEQGPAGPPGPPGTSITILGSYPTEGDLFSSQPTGNNGDGYIVSGYLYVWNGTAWENVGQVQGPQGASAYEVAVSNDPTIVSESAWLASLVGQSGQDGSNGADGRTVLHGIGTPIDNGVGSVDDFYIDTNTFNIYGPKTQTGGWGPPTALKGDKGDKGEKGEKGDTGGIGPQGPIGITPNITTTFVPLAAGSTAYFTQTGTAANPEFTFAIPRGADGANGTNGTNGTNGAPGVDGKTVLNGAGAPANSVGTVGDFYIDTTNNRLYGPKGTSAWSGYVSLVGPQGQTGATPNVGATVSPGAAGSNPQVSVTNAGTASPVLNFTIPRGDAGVGVIVLSPGVAVPSGTPVGTVVLRRTV